MVFHVVAALALLPVSGHPYDLVSLTSASGAWLRWGVPLFYRWKFGFDLSILAVGSQSLAFVAAHLGMSGAAAQALAWKLPLVLADLVVAAVLADLGRQLQCRRPALIATLWLISPVPLWVSAGHGQIESLTILAVVLSLDLSLRHRPLLAGIVAGLGTGIEYLPALTVLVVIFWCCVSVVERRELYRFAAGCAGALAFCFGPLLATSLGRTSILGGLSFSAAAASNPGNAHVAASVGWSLWSVLDLSPGPLWLAVALATSLAIMVLAARKARRTGSAVDSRRLGILVAGVLLLCVILFDPGALPQFAVLVLGGLCLVGLCADLSPAVIILGPSLQLAGGLLFVYGGSFQSYWYDMWARTGASGWPFPQSFLAADWSARAGVVIIALGLLLVSLRIRGAMAPARLRLIVARSSIAAGALGSAFLATWSLPPADWPARVGIVLVTLGLLLVSLRIRGAMAPARLRLIVARSSIAAGALGSVFLATWSLQPAYWQGVGARGPSTLADFNSITAYLPGAISNTPGHSLITFSPQELLAARESTVASSLELKVTTQPYFAQTTAGTAKFGKGAVQALRIPDWPRAKRQVHSLWVSTLIGRPAWRSRARVLLGAPALAAQGRRTDHQAGRRRPRRGRQALRRRADPAPAPRRLVISSSQTTWVAPGWAVITYDVPASLVSPEGQLTLSLREQRRSAGLIGWNGSLHMRWLLVSLHSGTASATIGGTRWRGTVTLPDPTPSWWLHPVEEASLRGVPLTPHRGVSVTRVLIGGKLAAIAGGGLAWPSPGVLDHTVDGPLLSVLGIIDLLALLCGAWGLSRWAAGTCPPYIGIGGLQAAGQSRGRHRARVLPGRYLLPTETAQ
jgi:hypothetical protein